MRGQREHLGDFFLDTIRAEKVLLKEQLQAEKLFNITICFVFESNRVFDTRPFSLFT